VVKQLAEMLLQCKQLYANEHSYGEALRWMSAFHAFCSEWPYAVFSISQYTCDVIVVPCCMNYTISTPFLSQNTVAISLLAEVCLNFLGLFGECVSIHCLDCSLVSTFSNEIHVSSPVTCMM
jgi:hypothetical protein